MRTLIVFIIVVILVQADAIPQWFPQNNYVRGGERIFFNENGKGYILKRMEYHNKTYLYKKFEDNWTKIYEFDSPVVYDLFQMDEENWFAICDNKIMKTKDAGYSWETIYENSEMSFKSIYFLDESNYWATADKRWTNEGLILKSTDKGETWETVFLSSYLELFTDIFFTNELIGFAYGNSQYKTTDGGIIWNHFNSPNFYRVEQINDSIFYVLTINNELYKTIDMGNSYTLLYSDPNRFTRYIYFKDELTGFLTGDPGNYLLKTTDGGISWVEVFCNFEYDINEIFMPSDSIVWAIDDQNIYISYDGGIYWQLIPFSGKELHKVILNSKNNLFAVGGSQVLSNDASILILKSTDSGTNWKILQSELCGVIYSTSFIDSLTGWFVGYKTKLIKTSNGGNSFEVIDPGLGETYYDIKFLNENIGWAVGDSGLIIKTTDGGTSWFSQPFPTSNRLQKIKLIEPDNILIWAAVDWNTSQPGFVIKSTSLGNNWSVVASNLYSNDLQVMESLKWRDINLSQVRETSDSGNFWQILWDNLSYGALLHIKFQNELSGFITTGQWKLLKSVNGGLNWTLDTLLPFRPNDLEFFDSTCGWIVGDLEIYKTNNGGSNIVSIFEEPNEINFPKIISLFQNYPNPFNPSTIISYQLPKAGNVTLKVFDVLGNEIATIVNEEKSAGSYEIEFNPVSSIKNPASGIYFYQLKAGEFVETKKMLLLK